MRRPKTREQVASKPNLLPSSSIPVMRPSGLRWSFRRLHQSSTIALTSGKKLAMVFGLVRSDVNEVRRCCHVSPKNKLRQFV